MPLLYCRGGGQMAKHRSVEAWRALVDGHAGSGLGVEAYCVRESIKVSSFRRWRRQLIGAPAMPAVARAKTPAVRTRKAAPTFVDLGAFSSAPRFELRLDLGQGLALTIVRS